MHPFVLVGSEAARVYRAVGNMHASSETSASCIGKKVGTPAGGAGTGPPLRRWPGSVGRCVQASTQALCKPHHQVGVSIAKKLFEEVKGGQQENKWHRATYKAGLGCRGGMRAVQPQGAPGA